MDLYLNNNSCTDKVLFDYSKKYPKGVTAGKYLKLERTGKSQQKNTRVTYENERVTYEHIRVA